MAKEDTAALPETIYAQVSPRSQGGTSLFDVSDPITFATVSQFLAPIDITADAVRGLRRAGFSVLQQSPALLNIAAPPSLYEQFFQTRLEVREVPVLKPWNRDGVAQFIDTLDNDIPGFLDTSGSPLSGILEGGALEKMRYPMQNSTPPNPNYWHLDVPDDVSRLLNADVAHDGGITGHGMRLVMVDSGWFAHPWFAANTFTGNVVLGPGSSNAAQDQNGHGTGESANAFSVAPGIDFTMVKMNFANSTGAFNATATLSPTPDVISCS